MSNIKNKLDETETRQPLLMHFSNVRTFCSDITICRSFHWQSSNFRFESNVKWFAKFVKGGGSTLRDWVRSRQVLKNSLPLMLWKYAFTAVLYVKWTEQIELIPTHRCRLWLLNDSCFVLYLANNCTMYLTTFFLTVSF